MKRVAIVVFEAAFDDDPKEYYYYTNDDTLKKGDFCIADSQPGLGIVKIRKFIPNHEKARRWLVQKIDLKAHELNMQRQEKIDHLKASLEERRKKFEEEHLWTMLAEKDSKAAELLNEIKSLEE